MLGGEGHIADMVNRMKENQRMLKSKREEVRDLRKIYVAHYNTPTSPHPSPENLGSIKNAIRMEIQQKRKRAWILTGCIMLLIIIGTIGMVLILSN